MKDSDEQNFDPILDDYAFFEAHATEAAADLKAYGRYLRMLPAEKGLVQMLDFGAGTGSFTQRLLRQTGWHPSNLKLTLIEPGEKAREEALQRLRPFSDHPIAHFPDLPTDLQARFDFVLANHVFYFVSDLVRVLEQLSQYCQPKGQFLVAMAGTKNVLIQCWETGFGLIGKSIPHHTAEDLETALENIGLAFAREWVPYTIVFPDTPENRLKILRFLFGQELAGLSQEALLRFFDQFAVAGEIRINTGHELYSVCP